MPRCSGVSRGTSTSLRRSLGHVGRPGQKIVAKGQGDLGEAFHGTGNHRHSVHGIRAAGDGRCKVAVVVNDIRQGGDLLRRAVSLDPDVDDRAFAQNQMSFHIRNAFKDFKQPNAKDDSARPGEADDKTSHGKVPFRFVSEKGSAANGRPA